MKKVLLLILLFYFGSYFAQIVPSSCIGTDSLIKKYMPAANQLSVRNTYQSNSTYKDSISIDKIQRSRYLKALIAVYNSTTLPARDTVVGIYNILPFNPIVNNILVQADSNLQWMKNLRANLTPTGYSTIDSLMAKYFLKKAFYSTWNSPNANIVLKTDTNCNTQQLAKFVKNLPGVATAQEDYLFGDGNDIEDSLTANYTWLVYSHGWLDCPNGCYYKRFWQFRVFNDCSVEYGGSFGAPLTVSVSENALDDRNIKVYPNPVSDQLNIEFNATESSAIKIELMNALGQVLITVDKASQKQELQLNDLPPGVYFLKLQNGQGLTTIKIQRE